MRELRLRGVHAAHEHVQHEVHALHLGEPVALLLGGEQGRHEVVARVAAPGREHALAPLVELAHRLLDPRAVVHQARRVELALDPVRPVVQPRRVLERSAHHRRDRQRRVRLGEVVHELAAAGVGHALPELLEEAAHRRPPAVGRARREGRVHQVAQAAVIVAVHVEDVAAHLLVERTVLHAEQLGDLHPREGRALRAQEEGRGLAVEHEVAELRLRQPGALGQVVHRRVEALAAQRRCRGSRTREARAR